MLSRLVNSLRHLGVLRGSAVFIRVPNRPTKSVNEQLTFRPVENFVSSTQTAETPSSQRTRRELFEVTEVIGPSSFAPLLEIIVEKANRQMLIIAVVKGVKI